MIEFKRVDQFDKGLICKLLRESYASLLEVKPDYAHELEENWRRTDQDLFDGPNSSGNVRIGTLGSEPIGFVTWYVEGAGVGSIGHNCIVPLHRGKGYGKEQVQLALAKLQSHVHRVRVTTANHPFFLPARKTYQACGFVEVSRSLAHTYRGLELIHYERSQKTRHLRSRPVQPLILVARSLASYFPRQVL